MTDQQNGERIIRRMPGGPNIPYPQGTLPKYTPGQKQKAMLTCARYAHDRDDLKDLLTVLGLLLP